MSRIERACMAARGFVRSIPPWSPPLSFLSPLSFTSSSPSVLPFFLLGCEDWEEIKVADGDWELLSLVCSQESILFFLSLSPFSHPFLLLVQVMIASGWEDYSSALPPYYQYFPSFPNRGGGIGVGRLLQGKEWKRPNGKKVRKKTKGKVILRPCPLRNW